MTWQHVTLAYLPLLGYLVMLIERRRQENKDSVEQIKKRMEALEHEIISRLQAHKEGLNAFLTQTREIHGIQAKQVGTLQAEKFNRR
jgi:hypothetical protein